MKRYCPVCDTRYDDFNQLAICPHETVASTTEKSSDVVCPHDGQKLQDHGSLLICPGCGYYIQSSDL